MEHQHEEHGQEEGRPLVLEFTHDVLQFANVIGGINGR